MVDSFTGTYSTATPTPTGIPSDPQLASYGVTQAEQLAQKVASLDPPPEAIYSSPFYRCLQTIKPSAAKLRQKGSGDGRVRVENGIRCVKIWWTLARQRIARDVCALMAILAVIDHSVTLEPSRCLIQSLHSEFFGTARFTHPAPASVPKLSEHFDFLDQTHTPSIRPSANGESLNTIHNRHAYALHQIIKALDEDPRQPRAALLCTHAASMICVGRVLTGRMPQDVGEEDFRCGTCALSCFKRRAAEEGTVVAREVKLWKENEPEIIPVVDWREGKGVGGGWDCTVNGDCSFLENGEERTW